MTAATITVIVGIIIFAVLAVVLINFVRKLIIKSNRKTND